MYKLKGVKTGRIYGIGKSNIKEIPYEYFCNSCGQLRLSVNTTLIGCGNCGSLDTIEGKPSTLDRDALKKQFKKKGEKENGKSDTTE